MNLVIATVGDDSIHPHWLLDKPEFDLVLLYYDNNPEVASSYTKYTPHVFSGKGFKWWLIKAFIDNNLEFVSKYDYIWFPDDDVFLNSLDINKLFNTSREHNLWISQPAMLGYVSHQITLPQRGNLLRFTNFVEVLAPMFNLESLLKVKHTFDANESAWGLDYLWPYLLEDPKDKVAIIDDIVMFHTKPVGGRKLESIMSTSRQKELEDTLAFYAPELIPQTKEYSKITLK